MQIQNSSYKSQNLKVKTYSQSFKGIPYAKVHLNGTSLKDEITLFKLGIKDMPFLNKMLDHLEFEKLFPNIKNRDHFEEWRTIVRDAINGLEFQTPESKTFLAARENMPCGIIGYSPTKKSVYLLEHLASWPLRPQESTKGSGRAMMRTIFKDSQLTKKQKVMIIQSYIRPNGKNCADFYESLGFRKNPITGMMEMVQEEGSKENIFETASKKLDEQMAFKKTPAGKDIDLSQILDINYFPDFIDKVQVKLNRFREMLRKM